MRRRATCAIAARAVLAVMPWNFPFWQVFRFAAPALMAGNVGLLKHASNVPRCALAIEESFRRAGFPDGVFQTLLDRLDAVAASSATRASWRSRSPAASRPAARWPRRPGARSRRRVLELGGSDPFIVMPERRPRRGRATAVDGALHQQRAVVHRRQALHRRTTRVADEFERALRRRDGGAEAWAIRWTRATEVGPLARARICDDVDGQVERVGRRRRAALSPAGSALTARATSIRRRCSPTSAGHRRRSTRRCSARWPRSSACADIDDAHRAGQRPPFGLGASVWTSDGDERGASSTRSKPGSVFVNGMVASDPRLPFGGVKRSGYGRELAAVGIREFLNAKRVYVESLTACARRDVFDPERLRRVAPQRRRAGSMGRSPGWRCLNRLPRGAPPARCAGLLGPAWAAHGVAQQPCRGWPRLRPP